MKIPQLLYKTVEKPTNTTEVENIINSVEKTVILPDDFYDTQVTLIDPDKNLYRVNVRGKDFNSRNIYIYTSFLAENTRDGFVFSPQLDQPKIYRK